MVDLVAASVPNDWLPKFVGHRIWSRPEKKPGAIAEWVELLDMWEEITEDPTYPYRFHAWIRWRGHAWSALLAQVVYVERVPRSECTPFVWTRDGEDVTHWTWTAPFDDPPQWPRHPKGWEPTVEEEPEELFTVATDVGDQFILPM